MHQKINKSSFLIFLAISFFTTCKQEKKGVPSQNEVSNELAIAKRWSEEKANAWGKISRG